MVISLTPITMKISFNLQLLLECRLNKDSYVFKISTRKPCVADEIIIYILSKILEVSICVFFRNTLWTTTQNDEVDSCDLYYAYTGDGYLMPIKHYDPAEEESLLAKYCPEKVKKPVSKGKGKGGKGGKGSKAHEPTPPGTPKRKTPPQGSSPKPAQKNPTKAQNAPSAPSTAQTQTCHPIKAQNAPSAPSTAQTQTCHPTKAQNAPTPSGPLHSPNPNLSPHQGPKHPLSPLHSLNPNLSPHQGPKSPRPKMPPQPPQPPPQPQPKPVTPLRAQNASSAPSTA